MWTKLIFQVDLEPNVIDEVRTGTYRSLFHPETMITEVRFVKPGSDFHRLARFLETRVDASAFEMGRRTEK